MTDADTLTTAAGAAAIDQIIEGMERSNRRAEIWKRWNDLNTEIISAVSVYAGMSPRTLNDERWQELRELSARAKATLAHALVELEGA